MRPRPGFGRAKEGLVKVTVSQRESVLSSSHMYKLVLTC